MKKTVTLVFFICLSTFVHATHLIGGEIQVKRINGQSLAYQIIVNLYTDDINGALASEAQSEITVCVGEAKQTVTAVRIFRIKVTDVVSLSTYSTTFVYAAPGTFTVSVALQNRDTNIANFSTANSSFSVQTTFATNINNATPVFRSLIGTQTANLKQIFSYDADAMDVDGDSLVYRLDASKQGTTSNCTIGKIPDFKYPNEVSREGIFRINAKTGKLTWNVPTQIGKYAFVVVVEEWRNGVRISETQREITLKVEERGGVPVLIPPFEYTDGGLITGITNQDNGRLLVYPTFTKDKLKVTFQQLKPQVVFYRIMDMNGKIVAEHQLTVPGLTYSHEFDLAHLPQGIYVVSVLAEKIFTEKFIKE